MSALGMVEWGVIVVCKSGAGPRPPPWHTPYMYTHTPPPPFRLSTAYCRGLSCPPNA